MASDGHQQSHVLISQQLAFAHASVLMARVSMHVSESGVCSCGLSSKHDTQEVQSVLPASICCHVL